MSDISRERIEVLEEREARRFVELRPRGNARIESARARMPNGVPSSWMVSLYEHPPIVVETGNGGAFTDLDGNRYLDFNLADTSMFAGYGVAAIAQAVSEQMAAGSQFLLPTEDSDLVAAELGRRFGLPLWQFTLSSTQANTEAIRVSRAVTGRDTVLMFDGKYHGHADELLGELEAGLVTPEGLGLPPDATRHVRLVQYNDLEAVERELGSGQIACVLAEAAITNTGVIQPAAGFHGIEATASAHGLDWRAHRLYNRSGYTHGPDLPANAIDARSSFDVELYELQRKYMANRGIWEAISSAGPACGIHTTTPDVEQYLNVLDTFIEDLMR